jgi:hypothetical protein
MTTRVDFYGIPGVPVRTLWLAQVPAVGEEAHVESRDARPQRVARVVWDFSKVDTPSAHINAVQADVYLEP